MSADPNKLAIFVTSPQNMTHVVGIAEAAARAGKKPMIFFTYKSIHLTKDPRFEPLAKLCGEDLPRHGADRQPALQGWAHRSPGV